MSLDLAPSLGTTRDVGQTSSSPSAPDTIRALSQRSGVSPSVLEQLSPEELSDLQRLEADVAQATSTPGGLTPDALRAVIEARDQVRADMSLRFADATITTDRPAKGTRPATDARALPPDATLEIRDNTITIRSNIHIYGSGASQEVAALFERQIRSDWGQNPTTGQPWTFTDHFTGREYEVHFDIDVDLYNPDHPQRGPGLFSGKNDPFNRDNYIEVISRADATTRATPEGPWRSYVRGGDAGEWQGASVGEWSIAGDRTASHEFGHTIGLGDRYEDVRVGDLDPTAVNPDLVYSQPMPGWSSNLMASLSGRVEQRSIDAVVGRFVERSRGAKPGETMRFEINDSRPSR